MAPRRRVWLLTIGLLPMANCPAIAAESLPLVIGPGIFSVTGAIAGHGTGGTRFDRMMPETSGVSAITMMVAATDRVKTIEDVTLRVSLLRRSDQQSAGQVNRLPVE